MKPSLESLYREGRKHAGWYDDTRAAFARMFGRRDGDLFLAFVAATSPRNRLKGNITKASKAWTQYKAGQPFTGFLPCHRTNLERAALGVSLSGPKVGPFHRALLGDPNAIVVDVWMCRVYGLRTNSPTVGDIRRIEKSIRRLARKVGDEPRRVQAAIWCAFKLRVEGPRATVAPYHKLLKGANLPC